jgi:hypothetical protein
MSLSHIRIRKASLLARLAAWKLGSAQVAITIGRTIHLHNTPVDVFRKDERWVRHELKHVEQFLRYGFFTFILLYAWESLRKGYYYNRFEVEAREAENMPAVPFLSRDYRKPGTFKVVLAG